MNNNLIPAKGYYSILQYVPPDKGFLKAQTATGNDRARRFFGPEENIDLDLDRLNAFKAAFEERVLIEAAKIMTLEEFRHFVSTRANQLLLSGRRVSRNQPLRDLCKPLAICSPSAGWKVKYSVM
jgi:hypothetical protein